MANSRKHLIYLVYGRQTYHQEALFSIASAFAHLRDGAAHGLTVRVYTDDPSPYAGLPVQVREVTAEELVAWCQPHGYHFRAKHVALRDALEDADQALLIDTDTFFHSSPLRLFDRIQPGSLLCNAIGARLANTVTSRSTATSRPTCSSAAGPTTRCTSSTPASSACLGKRRKYSTVRWN